MTTETQKQIIDEIKAKGITQSLTDLCYWLAGEEICVELDSRGNKIEEGDYILEFITSDMPKILLVIKGAPDEQRDKV